MIHKFQKDFLFQYFPMFVDIAIAKKTSCNTFILSRNKKTDS